MKRLPRTPKCVIRAVHVALLDEGGHHGGLRLALAAQVGQLCHEPAQRLRGRIIGRQFAGTVLRVEVVRLAVRLGQIIEQFASSIGLV